MIKHWIAIIWCLAFWGGFISGKSVFAGEWNDKPVMCEQKEVALEAIKALRILIKIYLFNIFSPLIICYCSVYIYL